MNDPKRCIISYALRGREDYPRGIPRLIASAKAHGHDGGFNNSFFIYAPEIEQDRIDGIPIVKDFTSAFIVPSHKETPYGFKPWMFRMSVALGFDQVLWCDSTIVIHKSLESIWNIARAQGLFVGTNPGCPQCFWTSDDALDQMGCPKDCMLDQIQACAMAFDFRHPKAVTVFDEWWRLCNDGVTFAGRSGSKRPEFRGHRHDQSAISWLTHKHGISQQPYGVLCYHNDLSKFPNAILANTGIGQI